MAITKRQYLALLRDRVATLEQVAEDGTQQGFERRLAAEREIAELNQRVWVLEAQNQPASREAAEKALAKEARTSVELAEDLEPATPSGIDRRLEAYRREAEARAYGISTAELNQKYAQLEGGV